MIATANFQADRKQLQKTLQFKHITYQHSHGKPMSVAAMAQLVSNTLYYKRFFPYYTYNLVCGLDEEGPHWQLSINSFADLHPLQVSCSMLDKHCNELR